MFASISMRRPNRSGSRQGSTPSPIPQSDRDTMADGVPDTDTDAVPDSFPDTDAIPDHFPDTDAVPDPDPDTRQNTTTSGTGFASTDYARRCRELMQLNNDLRAMGAETLLDLPRIAVIGGQSTGKSSLVEAVSKINVPRDAGTCTRCPMECSLTSSADTWSCVVSLRFDYDEHGRQLPSPRKENFGSVIVDRNDVELWLRRAQAAILSPHIQATYFETRTAQELRDIRTDPRTLKFSRNVVCIDINDPSATDLSFVDLPGLIQNEAQDTIDLIKNLAVSYIDSENTFILIAVPVSDDIENQQAVRLAREADPEGERTICVLTKPDMLSKGATSARQMWKDVLQGKIHRLKHGYYCVRLPDDDERSRNISHTECEKLATELFESTSPWSDIADRRRFGTANLVTDLSKLLIDLIEDSLPDLRNDVDRLLDECQEELAGIPVALKVDPTTEILNRISAFCAELERAVSGEGSKTLAQNNRKSYEVLKDKILATAPDFRPYSNDPPSRLWPGVEVSKTSNDAIKPLGLTQVRDVITESIAWELPHNIPFEAKKRLVSMSTSLWQSPTISCFERIVDNLSVVIYKSIETHFGRFSRLKDYVGRSIEKEVRSYKDDTLVALKKNLELEKAPLFTQNIQFLNSERAAWLERYRDRRGYGDTSFDEDTTVMAEVRAYFEVAYRRFVDYIPLTIEHELCQGLSSSLQRTLLRILISEKSPEQRSQLVSEDPAEAARRGRLTERRKRLMDIKEKLHASPMRAWTKGPSIDRRRKKMKDTSPERYETPVSILGDSPAYSRTPPPIISEDAGPSLIYAKHELGVEERCGIAAVVTPKRKKNKYQ